MVWQWSLSFLDMKIRVVVHLLMGSRAGPLPQYKQKHCASACAALHARSTLDLACGGACRVVASALYIWNPI